MKEEPNLKPGVVAVKQVEFNKSFFSSWRIYVKRYRRNKAAIIGLAVIFVFVLVGIIASIDELLSNILYGSEMRSLIFPYHPDAQFVGSSFETPSTAFWLGTDELGRDLFVRMAYASGLTLRVTLIAGFLGIGIGTLFGLLSGYFGGLIDGLISIITEILLAIPGFLLALGFIVVFKGQSLDNIMIAVGISSSPYYIRVIRSETIVQREQQYTKAARVLGANHTRILFKHILPNVLGLLITYGALGMASALLSITGLSFLELGPELGTPELGRMVVDYWKRYFISHPHMVFITGVPILLLVVSFNLLGDGLQEALDPRLEEEGSE